MIRASDMSGQVMICYNKGAREHKITRESEKMQKKRAQKNKK